MPISFSSLGGGESSGENLVFKPTAEGSYSIDLAPAIWYATTINAPKDIVLGGETIPASSSNRRIVSPNTISSITWEKDLEPQAFAQTLSGGNLSRGRLKYVNNRLFAIGTNSNPAIYESQDNGQTWTGISTNIPDGRPILDMDYLNGTYVISADVSTQPLWYTTDSTLQTWTNAPISKTRDGYGIKQIKSLNGKIFAFDTEYDALWESSNGTSWTRRGVPSQDIQGVTTMIHDGSQYIAGGGNGKIYTSSNGSSWTDITTSSFPGPENFDRIVTNLKYIDGKYIQFLNFQDYYYADSINGPWTKEDFGPNSAYRVVDVIYKPTTDVYVFLGIYNNKTLVRTTRTLTGSLTSRGSGLSESTQPDNVTGILLDNGDFAISGYGGVSVSGEPPFTQDQYLLLEKFADITELS